MLPSTKQYGISYRTGLSRSKLRRPPGRLFLCCLAGSFFVGKMFTYYTPTCEALVLVLVGGRRRRSRQIGGLRVEVLEGYLSKNQTTGVVKIREVTFELLREVGFRRGHIL